MDFFQLLKRLAGVSVVTSVITLGTSLLLAKIMIAEDFGRYSYYQSLLMILVNIIPFGSGLAVVVYLFSASDNRYTKIISNSLFYLMPISALLCFFGLLIFSHVVEGELDIEIIILLTLNAFFMSICLIGISFLSTKQLMKRYALYFCMYTVAVSVGGIAGYTLFQNIKLFYLTILVALVALSVFTFYIFYKENYLSIFLSSKSQTFFWSVKYGLPVVLNSTIMSFMVIGDRIMLGGLVALDTLAEYAIAALISSTTLFLVNNFALAWGTYLTKEVATLSRENLSQLYYNNKAKLLLVIPMGFSVYLVQFIIYGAFYEQDYPDLEVIILVLTIGYCWLGVSKYYVGYLSCLGKNYPILYISFISCVSMITLSILVLDDGILGMALSVSLSFFLQVILFNSITNKVFSSDVSR